MLYRSKRDSMLSSLNINPAASWSKKEYFNLAENLA